VGVWAGDDSPSKRDRQPSLCASTLCARPRLSLSKEGTKKRRSPSLPRTGADCISSRQPAKPRHIANLVSALNSDNGSVSVYLSVDFVNLQFVTHMAA
jgi:hypothetical protein